MLNLQDENRSKCRTPTVTSRFHRKSALVIASEDESQIAEILKSKALVYSRRQEMTCPKEKDGNDVVRDVAFVFDDMSADRLFEMLRSDIRGLSLLP